MTLHASKGLEFPVVFIIALEEGLMPHERSRADDDAMEEERRLLFVGMTRAEEELQLSMGQYREFRGQRRMTIPSPFLLELPRHELRMVGFGPQTAGQYRARGREMYEGDEAAEPEHVDAEAMDFDVHELEGDVPPGSDHEPADRAPMDRRLAQPDGRRGCRQPAMALATAAEMHDGGSRHRHGRFARRFCPRHGGAASGIWAGQNHGSERDRAAPRGHGRLCLDGRPEEIRPFAKSLPACQIAVAGRPRLAYRTLLRRC